MASAVAKPDGLLVVPPERELAFLHPLPVERLWGVGPVTAAKLHERGIATVGDLARVPERTLAAILGRAAGRHLHALANNRDPRPVRPRRRRRSIGSQHALGLSALARASSTPSSSRSSTGSRAACARRARRPHGRPAPPLRRLHARDALADRCAHPTAQTATLLAAARSLLAAALPMIEERGLTLIGFTIANLDDDLPFQLALPFDAEAARSSTRRSTRSATASGRRGHACRPARPDGGLSVPLLPD